MVNKTTSRSGGKKRASSIDNPAHQSNVKPGEPEFLAITIDHTIKNRANAIRPLTPAEKKLLSDLEKTVKVRTKLIDEVSDHRRGADVKIGAAIGSLEADLRQFSANKSPPRLKALVWAIKAYVIAGSRSEYAYEKRSVQKSGSVSAFEVRSFKCNKLVTDAIATGAMVGLAQSASQARGIHAKTDATGTWPALANSFASKTERLYNLTKGVDFAADKVANGEIVAFPAKIGSGHSGLSLGNGLILSAKVLGLEVGTVTYERAEHDNNARHRIYNGGA